MATTPTTTTSSGAATSGTNPKTFLSVPAPFRVTGNTAADMRALVEWVQGIFDALVRSDTYLKATQQYNNAIFNASDLPDPSSTTLFKAQDTANNAYVLATRLQGDIVGSITISGTDRSADYTFEKAQKDNTYTVIISVLEKLGSPPAEALLVLQIDRLAEKFTLTIDAAPGAGNSVTYQFLVVRRE